MTRARKVRPLRGVLVMHNDRAPLGWVEIQRDDSPDDGGPVIASDVDAALAVAKRARCPGLAMLYTGDAAFYQLLERAPDRPREPEIGIAVVPAFVARKAGLRFTREAIGT